MKKRIIRTLVTMGLAVSVIMPGAQVFAQETQSVEMRSLGELTDAGDKLKKEEWDKIKTFRGLGHEVWKCGDYTGFLSNDKKIDKYIFPNIIIKSKEYLIVYTSNKNTIYEGEIHTNFILKDNEKITLYDKYKNEYEEIHNRCFRGGCSHRRLR